MAPTLVLMWSLGLVLGLLCSPDLSQYPEFTGFSDYGGISPGPLSCLPGAPTCADSSNEEDPHLFNTDALADIDFFGWNLADLSISGHTFHHAPLMSNLSNQDESSNNNDDDDDDGSSDSGGGDSSNGRVEPDNPDDLDGPLANGPQIQVPPDDPSRIAGDPGDDNKW
ncbi:hypothetical protein FRC11_010602 [Ceratobasidium sp. 423]|nr:hypothetical protein FRC11_010602 [Ceratobasidium sp. 423]